MFIKLEKMFLVCVIKGNLFHFLFFFYHIVMLLKLYNIATYPNAPTYTHFFLNFQYCKSYSKQLFTQKMCNVIFIHKEHI